MARHRTPVAPSGLVQIMKCWTANFGRAATGSPGDGRIRRVSRSIRRRSTPPFAPGVKSSAREKVYKTDPDREMKDSRVRPTEEGEEWQRLR
jgi:hypothetical protein